jgi:N-formylglutamate amidohydrolase
LQLEINRSLYADENLLQKKDNFDVIKNDVSEAVMTFAEEIKR